MKVQTKLSLKLKSIINIVYIIEHHLFYSMHGESLSYQFIGILMST